MHYIGVVSYNINCNFTNYGSALQSWALCQSIDRIGAIFGKKSKLIDYCPRVLEDCDIFNPVKKMWDTNEEARKMVKLSMPAIKENYQKFEDFYTRKTPRTKKKYNDNNFNDVIKDEAIIGFVCGSDTIFCINEFKGFVDGYFANFSCMRGKSVSYAASFGDSSFTQQDYITLNNRLKNFKAIGVREFNMLDYIRNHCEVRTERVLDPTLLLEASHYDRIIAEPQIEGNYLLYYSRRFNQRMEQFAEQLAKERNLKIVEISIRATNSAKGHIMRYDAGVEEFLSLVKYAKCVVTNSFHGIIFSIQFRTPFYCFSREQGDTKTREVLNLFGLSDYVLKDSSGQVPSMIDFDKVHERIAKARKDSEAYLKYALDLL